MLTIPLLLQDSDKGRGGRSQSSSASSLFSQGTQPESPTTSDPDEGSSGSSASEDDSKSSGKGEAGSDDGASDSSGSSEDESSSSSESGSEEASDDEGTQQDGLDNEGEGSGSETEESDARGGNSPFESDHDESPPKASPPVRKAPEVNLNTSQMLSLPDLDSKNLEEEWKAKWCRDACLLDKYFGKWWDQKISEGLWQWDECDKMTCDRTDPCKEAKSPDQLGPPLDYMTNSRVFKTKKTNEYDLRRFYQVGLSGALPEFPSTRTPATWEQVGSLLLKARALGWPNLIVVHSQDEVTAVCLLQELHIKDSLHHLPMETKVEAGSKPIQKLSFCPFYQYSGSNDPSYMNHIICRHYNTNYGCGKCLDEVYIMGQLLHKHMQTCKGLPKEAVDKATAEDTDSAASGKKKKSKSRDLPSDSQPPPQSSQGNLQASPHHSQHTKEKAATTPKKSDSSKKKKCSSSH